MAIIIETCPKCGHDLIDTVICTNPPIPKKGCPNCGWSWEGEPEEIIRVPFGGNSYVFDNGGIFGTGTCLTGSMYNEPIYNYGDNTINISEAQQAFARVIEDHINKQLANKIT